MSDGTGKGGALLALDCSLKRTNAAVLSLSEGELLAVKRLDIGRRQVVELPLAMEGLLAETGRSFGDLGLVAVTNGPGYFTGIRVGVSYGAALAHGLGLKIAPAFTLHMLTFPWLSQAKTVLVFADPPYNQGWGKTLPHTNDLEKILKRDGVLVMEYSAREALDVPPGLGRNEHLRLPRDGRMKK
ncbi:MAG: tRNA (adenosine(37)-N6)-threonylcarbamoyltransferase complex dimerization subunit type 1 TsaB [Synergistaceae bacterium]|jgi:tRNA threonylcarbamoyl adenosine modification protein YeaZ|nr:tRNA (adenosine(37)-N6)-threonylcarbamoyltransferase complex dimerization subunit type 1 TsaB [Synergistaceae bacterium]